MRKNIIKDSSEKAEPVVRTNFKRESFEALKSRMEEQQLQKLTESEEEE